MKVYSTKLCQEFEIGDIFVIMDSNDNPLIHVKSNGNGVSISTFQKMMITPITADHILITQTEE